MGPWCEGGGVDGRGRADTLILLPDSLPYLPVKAGALGGRQQPEWQPEWAGLSGVKILGTPALVGEMEFGSCFLPR